MRKKILCGLLVCLMLISAFAGLAATSYDSISFSVNSVVMGLNSTYTLEATSTPAGVKASELKWSSDDTRVATVSNGVIVSKGVYGGCIITATTSDGSLTARCYVGVGAPYGYTGGYYNGYYSGDYYPYYYYDSGYYYPYYNGSYYNDYYNSVYYNDYYYNYYNSGYYNSYYYNNYYPYDYSTYIDKYGRVVYSVNKTNPVDVVGHGKATSAQTFAIEVEQALHTTYNGDSVGFAYVNNSNALTVTPERTGSEANAVSLPKNTMNRFNRFGYSSLRYRLPELEVSIYPDLVGDRALNLTVNKASASGLDKVLAGPWKVGADSSEKALMLRFILDGKYGRNQLAVVKLVDGEWEELESASWTLLKATAGDSYTYSVRTEKVEPGTYAVVRAN